MPYSLPTEQTKLILNSFIVSQFSYCPKRNKRINDIYERALKIVYNDYKSLFQKLLAENNSLTRE